MKPEAAAALPPYFGIDPDAALAALGAPTVTEEFQRIAKACEAGKTSNPNTDVLFKSSSGL